MQRELSQGRAGAGRARPPLRWAPCIPAVRALRLARHAPALGPSWSAPLQRFLPAAQQPESRPAPAVLAVLTLRCDLKASSWNRLSPSSGPLHRLPPEPAWDALPTFPAHPSGPPSGPHLVDPPSGSFPGPRSAAPIALSPSGTVGPGGQDWGGLQGPEFRWQKVRRAPNVGS